MGKTVESFRMALEGEINHWSGFAYALRKPDKEAFDELMDMCRTYASESNEESVPFESKPESSIQVVPNGGEQRRLF